MPNSDKAIFSTHCHDDLGLAVANSLAAIQGGVRQIECTINGIGERAGNASLEELVMALRVRPRSPAVRHRRSSPQRCSTTSQLLSQLTDEPVQSNKAIVGRNAFAHEAGIHQDGDAEGLAHLRDHEAAGRRPDRRAAGARPPLRASRRRSAAASSSGFTLTTDELAQVYHAVITMGEHRKSIGDNDLRRMVERVRSRRSRRRRLTHVETVGYGHGV